MDSVMQSIADEVQRQAEQRDEYSRSLQTSLAKLLSYVQHQSHCATRYRMGCSCGLDKVKEEWTKKVFK